MNETETRLPEPGRRPSRFNAGFAVLVLGSSLLGIFLTLQISPREAGHSYILFIIGSAALAGLGIVLIRKG